MDRISQSLVVQDHQQLSGDIDRGLSRTAETVSIRNKTTALTFDVEKQKRPGTHHGMGGRRRAMTAEAREQSITPQIAAKICRHMLEHCNGSIAGVSEKMTQSLLQDFQSRNESNSLSISSNFAESFRIHVDELIRVKEMAGYEILPAPILSICYKVPALRNIMSGTGNCMDRHTTSTWISVSGRINCTCVGSTQHRIAGIEVSTSENN